MKKSLLYIGSGTDAYPLTLKKFREEYDMIIFGDALPNQPDRGYPGSIEGILSKLCDKGGYLAGLSIGDFKKINDNTYTANLDGCQFIYYFNILEHPIPDEVLEKVRLIYMHGFEPDVSLIQKIPNCKMAYATENCVGKLYWKIYEQSGLDLYEWNSKTIIPEMVWNDEDEEFEINE